MSWTTMQTIDGPKEEPIFLRVSVGITRRWMNDRYFFGRKDAFGKTRSCNCLDEEDDNVEQPC